MNLPGSRTPPGKEKQMQNKPLLRTADI